VAAIAPGTVASRVNVVSSFVEMRMGLMIWEW
jgi:hypothetical protein